jgi:putative membrane protein
MPSPALPWFELARFGRSRLARAAVVAVTVIPLILAALYVWANIDPTGRLDEVKAAVVNQDELVEVKDPDGKKQPVAIGRELAGNLTSDDSQDNFDWVLTDAKDAQQGLVDGEYKAVLTIPENLSEAATSTSGDPQDAVQGHLKLRTNDAVNYVSGTIAESIAKAAKTALNTQVTETYLDNIYLSFSDMKMKLSEAATGANELAGGADELAGGTRKLADGAAQASDGAGQLANGLGRMEKETSTLPRDTQRLAEGSRQVADGTAQLSGVVQQFSQAIGSATANADADIARLDTLLRKLAEQCRAAPTPGVDCKELEDAAARTGELKAFVQQMQTETKGAASQVKLLADGADQVATGNEKLAQNVPLLVASIGRASSGASQLADGTDQLSTGATKAADGADQLSAGALELSTGLREGAGAVPDYDKSERERMSETVATPIEDASDRLHPVSNNGEALAPYFIAIALWIGAMAIYLLLRPLSDRAIASTAGDVRTAFAGFVPGLALSLVQAALLVGALQWIVGIHPASPWLFLGMTVAAAVTFTAVNQMLVALLGGAGRFIALVLLALQLAAAGGTYPIETSPGFFGFLHDLLPMSHVVDGLRAASAGGSEGVGGVFLALAVFTVFSLALTVVASRRRQTVTLTRLRPSTA